MKKIFFIAISAIMLTSCATVVNGTSQKIKVTSKSNKQIQIINENGIIVASGRGTVEAQLAKSSKAFTGAYYKIKTTSETVNVNPKINIGAFAVGNFFLPGFWGYIVDGATGAMYDLEANGNYLTELEMK